MSEKGRIVVIGSGAAGTAAARSLADSGWTVTVAEDRKVGGTCLWRGCMPKKALYTSARAARFVRGVEQFGVSCSGASVDWQGVLAWKWHAQETYAGDQEGLLEDRGIALVSGSARFASPSAVVVGSAELEFDNAVIASGSVPVLPPVEGIELADTSEDALGYTEPPRSILIIGGGYIAFEFAGIFASFGTQVTVVVSSAPLKASDPEAVAVAIRHLERLGVTFINGYRLDAISGERRCAHGHRQRLLRREDRPFCREGASGDGTSSGARRTGSDLPLVSKSTSAGRWSSTGRFGRRTNGCGPLVTQPAVTCRPL